MRKSLSPLLVIPNILKDSSPANELFSRLNMYGRVVAEVSGNSESGLNILTGSLSNKSITTQSELYPFLEITFSQLGLFGLIKNLRELLKANIGLISTIIAGDPWVGFLICLLASIRTRIPIQVSIHGEPYLKENYSADVKSCLKDFWLRLFLRRADSVRLVSVHQVSYIQERYAIDRQKIIISPIPVLIPDKFKNVKKEKNIIAFVGRIHKERGIDLWIEIIAKLRDVTEDFELLIIGDGKESHHFEQGLRELDVPFKFTGRLSNIEVQGTWNKVSVLLSTAPTESFGLTLREAQMSGVYVVAFENFGTKANRDLFPKGISLFTDIETAVKELSLHLNTILRIEDQMQFCKKQLEINNASLLTMVSSWKISKESN